MATLPTDGVMVLYPIDPLPVVNVLVHTMDSGKLSGVQKSASPAKSEYITINYRILEGNFKAFNDFLEANRGIDITLTHVGVTPFIRSVESNLALIVGVSGPTRPKHAYWEMSVTYLYKGAP